MNTLTYRFTTTHSQNLPRPSSLLRHRVCASAGPSSSRETVDTVDRRQDKQSHQPLHQKTLAASCTLFLSATPSSGRTGFAQAQDHHLRGRRSTQSTGDRINILTSHYIRRLLQHLARPSSPLRPLLKNRGLRKRKTIIFPGDSRHGRQATASTLSPTPTPVHIYRIYPALPQCSAFGFAQAHNHLLPGRRATRSTGDKINSLTNHYNSRHLQNLARPSSTCPGDGRHGRQATKQKNAILCQ